MIWHSIGARGVDTISFEKVWDKHWYEISHGIGFYWYHTMICYNGGISYDTSGGLDKHGAWSTAHGAWRMEHGAWTASMEYGKHGVRQAWSIGARQAWSTEHGRQAWEYDSSHHSSHQSHSSDV